MIKSFSLSILLVFLTMFIAVAQSNSNVDNSLHQAVRFKKFDRVKKLVKKDADVNAYDQFGLTPLHWAKEDDQLEIAKFLVENGADVNKKTKKGGLTPLIYSTNKNSINIAGFYIEKGADINAKTDQNYNALHEASRKNSMQVVELLLQKGANINEAGGVTDCPPMVWAAQQDAVDVAEFYLTSKNVDVNTTCNNEWTALHWAAQNKSTRVVKLLVEKGANKELRNSEGKTAYEIAMESGFNEIAEELK